MATYKELMDQRAALEVQLAEAKKAEAVPALAKVRELIEEFGFTVQQTHPTSKAGKGPRGGSQVAAKYKDPDSGATWTGRGKPPRWIAGKDRATFEI